MDAEPKESTEISGAAMDVDGPSKQNTPPASSSSSEDAKRAEIAAIDDAEIEDALSDATEDAGAAEESKESTSTADCPECAKRPKRKERGLPFGRKPGQNATKKPKADPKTPWGKWQREYLDSHPEMRPEVATQIARVVYVPLHADGRPAPKSFERLLRETYSFLDPAWKHMKNEEDANKAVRRWVEKLLIDTLKQSEAARAGVLL